MGVSRWVIGLVSGLLLCANALATWSIVVVNRATGEVCSATATCIQGFGLEVSVPVIVVGKGAGASQAFVLSSAANRKIMFSGFKNQWTSDRILDKILLTDSNVKVRQFGIVAMQSPPVTFSGNDLTTQSAFAWAGGISGEVGDLAYAIQGNSITGEPVVLAAERALLETPGDLSMKVMMAMEAARAMGGDGRCSCLPADADGCGSPPPDFDKTAHQAVMFLARPGDSNGVCNGNLGCVNGDYYLSLLVGGDWSDPDPVYELRDAYAAWRASKAGVPDHYLSEVSVDRQSLVADGRSRARVRVRMIDLDGEPLTQGGALLTFKKQNSGFKTAEPGPVTDHGDGTYSFDLIATTHAGLGEWRIEVDTGGTNFIRLSPNLMLETSPLTDLHVGVQQFKAGSDQLVPFTLNRPPAEQGRPYRILGTLSGTVPGFDLGGLHYPLNRDAFLSYTWTTPGPPDFHGITGVLDGVGRAQAWFRLAPAVSSTLIGESFDFSLWLGGATPEVVGSAGFEVGL